MKIKNTNIDLNIITTGCKNPITTRQTGTPLSSMLSLFSALSWWSSCNR